MKAYRLTARKGDRKSIKSFRALDDTEATFRAVHIVMTKAADDIELWGRGRIELRDLSRGTILRTMDEKV